MRYVGCWRHSAGAAASIAAAAASVAFTTDVSGLTDGAAVVASMTTTSSLELPFHLPQSLPAGGIVREHHSAGVEKDTNHGVDAAESRRSHHAGTSRGVQEPRPHASSLLESHQESSVESRLIFLLPLFMGSDPITQANLLLALCWLIPVIWAFATTVMSPLDLVQDEFALRQRDLRRMEKTYDEMIVDIEEKMRDMVEKQIDWVQYSLNHKADNFRVFLERVNDRLFGLGDDITNVKLTSDFAWFVDRWLECFLECAHDPIVQPFFNISKADTGSCTSVKQICQLLLQAIPAQPVNLITPSLENCSSFQLGGPLAKMFSQNREKVTPIDRRSSKRGCTWVQICQLNPHYINDRVVKNGSNYPFQINICFLKVWILSERHVMYLSVFGFGFALSVYMMMFQGRICQVATMSGLALVVTIVYKFEQMDVQASIQIQQAEVEKEINEVRMKQKEVTKFYESVNKLSCVWTYRTRARLDILKAIYCILLNTIWSSSTAVQSFMKLVENGWESQRRQIDDLQYWLNEEDPRLNEPICKCIWQQLERSATSLRSSQVEDVTMKHFNVLNFVAVRILGCQDLPLQGFSGISAFVQVRSGEGGSESWQKTDTVAGTRNPKWHSDGLNAEFHINMPSDDNALLKLEVRDDPCLARQSVLGRLDIHITQLAPAQWTTMIQPLQHASCGMIELEVYRATRARELIDVIPAKPPQTPEATIKTPKGLGVASSTGEKPNGRVQ